MVSWILSCALTWSHAAFSREDTRAIAHRWKPVTVPVDDGIVLHTDRLRKYTRMMVQLRTGTDGSFGLCSEHGEVMSLFLVRPDEHAHVLTAVLWSNEDRAYHERAITEVSDWNELCFSRGLTPGTELGVNDRSLFMV